MRFGDFALTQPIAFAVHLEDVDVVVRRSRMVPVRRSATVRSSENGAVDFFDRL